MNASYTIEGNQNTIKRKIPALRWCCNPNQLAIPASSLLVDKKSQKSASGKRATFHLFAYLNDGQNPSSVVCVFVLWTIKTDWPWKIAHILFHSHSEIRSFDLCFNHPNLNWIIISVLKVLTFIRYILWAWSKYYLDIITLYIEQHCQ